MVGALPIEPAYGSWVRSTSRVMKGNSSGGTSPRASAFVDTATQGSYIYGLHGYVYPMAQSTRAPTPQFASPGANPTLETIEYIRSALRNDSGPMSRNQLLAILADWGHSTSRQSLNAALSFLEADGSVVFGSKG